MSTPDWATLFPTPKANPPSLPRTTLLQWLNEDKKPGGDFLLIDVRKDDHAGGTIKSSLNLPAQSLYPSLETLFTLVRKAEVRDVVFYCGSCGGRGTRAAGWFADYLIEQGISESEIKSWKLEGGIKGWVKGGEEYTGLMDGYDSAAREN